ncbi:DUF4229 domain-containing protein [Rhodococcus sp. GXMU-t2271]|uniref:Uncharacterized protein n=3 Tax=Rhodococcus TaxID=1827 RepID=M2ZPV2_9NOCA|nr:MULTISPECIES: DUF4229 domain-containing protein [Rhodococcus]EME62379.1 hypothetical protein G352_17534 [Rhodococcus ruber BKS 20-38]KOS55662.1 membrane protein [Rhodococcus rhodochrous KG-21]MDM7489447.1 DUF4229 domain-containing protein [Rhodococcus indonesiensis]
MSEASQNRPDQPGNPGRPGNAGTDRGTLARDVALYSLARLLLVLVLAVVILYLPRLFGVEIPLLVAALFAVLIALPLSLVVFAPLRRRVNAGIASVDARRRADRADLQSRLRGEDRR